ncbi:MAG: hypothetical protein JSV18_04530 [Candidatus Bathyarchaeota archaeon]|nr:MAG: hypothetical protein JSV18_04530 [Candidatus Bathyarchaeota archaeon]
MSYPIGKCPKCGQMVTKRDLSVVQIRTTFWRPHYAYVCRKCEHIIGFGSNAPW